jgi:hypothetical protein
MSTRAAEGLIETLDGSTGSAPTFVNGNHHDHREH